MKYTTTIKKWFYIDNIVTYTLPWNQENGTFIGWQLICQIMTWIKCRYFMDLAVILKLFLKTKQSTVIHWQKYPRFLMVLLKIILG